MKIVVRIIENVNLYSKGGMGETNRTLYPYMFMYVLMNEVNQSSKSLLIKALVPV